MITALKTGEWDIVISDFRMPNFSGPQALALLKKLELDLPFIIVSGTVGELTAVESMKAGAHDYIMKDNLTRLVPAIRREIREARDRRERRQADIALRESEERFREIVIQQRQFLKDILFSVTEGKLRLCDSKKDLPAPFPFQR